MSDRPPTLLTHLKPVALTVVDSLLVLAGVVVAVAIPMALDLPGWTVLLSLAFVAVFLWAVLDLRTHPVHAFGTRRRVEYAVAREGVCGECGSTIDVGEKRRYAEQAVAFGVPLKTLDWGVNRYCLDCRDNEGAGDRVRSEKRRPPRERELA